METLTGKQRKILRAQAHHLDAVIMVGKQGASDSLITAVDSALNDHELIKIKFVDLKDEKNAITDTIVEKTGSHVVGKIGNTSILFRQNKDPQKRKYKI